MPPIKNNHVNKWLFYKWLPLQDAFRTLDWVEAREGLKESALLIV